MAPPTAPATVVYGDSVGGANVTFAVSYHRRAGLWPDNALCQLHWSRIHPVSGAELTAASTPAGAGDAVRASIAEVVLNGNLQQAHIIVSGRSDAWYQ